MQTRRWQRNLLQALLLRPGWAAVLVVALGALLRFWYLGQIRIGYDDSYPAYDALRMLDGHQILWLGLRSTVFMNNPPWMSYLQALPLALWRSLWGPMAMIVALNTVAVWLVYRTGRLLLGEGTGFLAALLFAINPWVVFFSRKTQAQTMPFLMALLAWGLWPVLAAQSAGVAPSPIRRRVVTAGVALAALMGTYLQAWGVVAQVMPLVVWARRRIPRRAFLFAVLVVLLVVVLYGIGITTQWGENATKLTRFGSGAWHLTREGLDHALRLVTGWDFEATYGTDTGDYATRHSLTTAAHILLSLAVAAGVVRALLAISRRSAAQRTAVVLLCWWVVPILLMSVSAYPVHPHYLFITLPAGHLLAAWGLVSLARRPWQRGALAGLLLALALLFSLNLYRADQSIAAQPTQPRLEQWSLQASDMVGQKLRLLTAGDAPRRVVAPSNDQVLSAISGTWLSVEPNPGYPYLVILPAQAPLLYVFINTQEEPGALGPLEESFPQHALQFSDGTQVSFVRAPVYDREAASRLPRTPLDWPSEAGITLLGYDLPADLRAGGPISCTTYWRVEELRPAHGAWYVGAFYQVLNEQGQKVANVSGSGRWGGDWQVGQVVIERMTIPLPSGLQPGDYHLLIGLFDTIRSQNYALLAPQGPQYALTIPLHLSADQP